MALSSTVHYDVRSSASDLNGGGFNTAASGTDYSQSDTAHIAFTDLVIGATNTQLTSAANPFTSDLVGNTIRISAGTGFTTGLYEVKTVASGVATMDRAVGTAASTGGVGNLGGAVALPSTVAPVSGNFIWIKTGTYTVTSTLSCPTSATVTITSYSSTHGDNAGSVTITTATNSVSIITAPFSGNLTVYNLGFSCTATTKGSGITSSGSSSIFVSRCSFDGFTNGIFSSTTAIVSVQGTYIVNSGTSAISGSPSGGHVVVSNCYLRNSGSGTGVNYSSGNLFVQGSVIVGFTTGLIVAGANNVSLRNNTIASNSGSGISVNGGLTGPFRLVSNLIYGNAGRGLNAPTVGTFSIYLAQNNAWGANTLGDYSAGISAGASDQALTASPFTATGSGDYSLNSAAAGGALCKGAGYPGTFPGGASIGYLDIGAVQSQGTASSNSGNYGFIA